MTDVRSRRMADKTALVAGAASGIGRATAVLLAREGAAVLCADLDAEGAGATAGLIEEMGGNASSGRLDVTSEESWRNALERTVDLFGRFNVLVNSAGISFGKPVTDMSLDEWRRVMAVNLDGVFHCAQEAARRMVAAGDGALLFTASTNGMIGHPLYADYNASKAGVILLARTLALELAPAVRVNAVCPGYVLTPMQEREYTPEMLDEVNRRIPLRRHATPEEVAGVFAFLASDEARYITGQALVVDGGETAGGVASRHGPLE
ncbi:MAG TPA: SDR family oxidoreductase [Thermoanaerobaculia bacterium]|nr:SDR family oxidoreductase [Thermoanaerobaculia bacterium]